MTDSMLSSMDPLRPFGLQSVRPQRRANGYHLKRTSAPKHSLILRSPARIVCFPVGSAEMRILMIGISLPSRQPDLHAASFTVIFVTLTASTAVIRTARRRRTPTPPSGWEAGRPSHVYQQAPKHLLRTYPSHCRSVLRNLDGIANLIWDAFACQTMYKDDV